MGAGTEDVTATAVRLGYSARRELRDGRPTLIVEDVPIFCACERGELKFDEAWVAAAVANAKRLEREQGYFPPLHVRHHKPGRDADEVRGVGYFRVKGTRSMLLNGKMRLAVVADLVVTDEWGQAEILALRYPYRSVEIFDVEAPPSLDGLALLSDEAPFLQFPMLAVREVREAEASSGTVPGFDPVANATFCRGDFFDASALDSTVVACFRRGSTARLLFRGGTMEDQEKPDGEETEGEVIASGASENFQDGEGDDENDENAQGEEGELDVDSVVKAIESGSISVEQMKRILAAIQAQESGDDGGDVESPADQAPAPAVSPGAVEVMEKLPKEAAALFASMQSTIGTLSGKVKALEVKDGTRDASEERDRDVRLALKRLAGRPLGANPEAELVAFHAEHGAGSFKAYVDSLAKHLGVPPTDDAGGRVPDSKTPKEALAFQAEGVDAVDQAAAFAVEYDQLRGAGAPMRMSRERYVNINMSKAGFDVPKPAKKASA